MSDAHPAGLTHLDAAGHAHMVDVTGKPVTERTATASGFVRLSAPAVAALRDGAVPKGDALATARIAGIMGAKKTPELIPLCHPLMISGVQVECAVVEDDGAGAGGVELAATVTTAERTGVEMEALTAVSVAALTVIDMVKALDRAAVIERVRVEAKSGGRSGTWRREQHD